MIKSTKRGFTLIELLVVIAIIGILSSVVIASMNSARKKSRDARRISDISNIKTAMEMYYDANQSYPSAAAGLAVLATAYIPKVPVDPTTAVGYTYEPVGTGTCAPLAVSPNGPCTSYHLGAVLEDNTNPALDGDAETSTATFFQNGDVNCTTANAGGDDICYNVTP